MPKGAKSTELHDRHHDEYAAQKKEACERCCQRADGERDELGFLTRKRRPLTVHHVDGNVENNVPANLMTLCRPCHDKEHSFSSPIAQ